MVWMRDVVCVDSPVDGNPERQQMIFFAVSSATSFFRPRIFRYSESSALQDSRPTRREPENANESPRPPGSPRRPARRYMKVRLVRVWMVSASFFKWRSRRRRPPSAAARGGPPRTARRFALFARYALPEQSSLRRGVPGSSPVFMRERRRSLCAPSEPALF